MTSLLEICLSLLEADGPQTYLDRVSQAVAAMEFEHFGGSLILDESCAQRQGQVRIVETFDNVSSRIDGYAEPEIHQRDPVMQAVRSSPLPIVWSAETYHRAGLNDLGDQVAQGGIRCGITMALHQPGGRHLVLGVGTSRPLILTSLQRQRAMAELSLVVAYAYEAGQRLYLTPNSVHVNPLSARERECLQWTAAGKTAWETGVIMAIAESTVNKHLVSAIEKLGCSNKTHAVAKALQSGWL